MFWCPHCSMLSTILFGIVSSDSGSTIMLMLTIYEQGRQQNINLFIPVALQVQYISVYIIENVTIVLFCEFCNRRHTMQ